MTAFEYRQKRQCVYLLRIAKLKRIEFINAIELYSARFAEFWEKLIERKLSG